MNKSNLFLSLSVSPFLVCFVRLYTNARDYFCSNLSFKLNIRYFVFILMLRSSNLYHSVLLNFLKLIFLRAIKRKTFLIISIFFKYMSLSFNLYRFYFSVIAFNLIVDCFISFHLKLYKFWACKQ